MNLDSKIVDADFEPVKEIVMKTFWMKSHGRKSLIEFVNIRQIDGSSESFAET